jgi:predicted aldo/keto reductase-like oxidoreductase
MSKKTSRLTRRKFMSKGLAGMAGAMAFTGMGQAKSRKDSITNQSEQKIIYRTLGKTGLKLPIVSMGSMDATSEALLRTALDSGIRHIATAQYYMKGKVEKFVGKVMKNYPREDIIVATGVAPSPLDWNAGVYSEKTDIAKYHNDVEVSLKNLDVDYVDILYLPFAAKKQSVLFEPLMKAMEKIKKDGKARFLGIASHSFVIEALRTAADSGFYDVAMPAYNFQIQDMEERKKAVEYAAGKGMGIVAMKTMIGDSWKNKSEQTPSNSKAALKWVLQNENVHTCVPGATTFDQLESNLSIMSDLTLTAEEKEYLKKARGTYPDGFFCQGCGTCLEQCRMAPDIPTLMRAYMYAYAYNDLAAASRCIEAVKDDPLPCSECSGCVVNCPMGFDIQTKALDIVRLRNFPGDFLT